MNAKNPPSRQKRRTSRDFRELAEKLKPEAKPLKLSASEKAKKADDEAQVREVERMMFGPGPATKVERESGDDE